MHWTVRSRLYTVLAPQYWPSQEQLLSLLHIDRSIIIISYGGKTDHRPGFTYTRSDSVIHAFRGTSGSVVDALGCVYQANKLHSVELYGDVEFKEVFVPQNVENIPGSGKNSIRVIDNLKSGAEQPYTEGLETKVFESEETTVTTFEAYDLSVSVSAGVDLKVFSAGTTFEAGSSWGTETIKKNTYQKEHTLSYTLPIVVPPFTKTTVTMFFDEVRYESTWTAPLRCAFRQAPNDKLNGASFEGLTVGERPLARTTITLVEERAPTPSPACFSGYNTILEKTKGRIAMSELQVGDFVQSTGGGTPSFSRVYSFAHWDPSMWSKFVVLHSSDVKLELSPDHIVHVNGSMTRARDAKVGDTLLLVDSGNSHTVQITHMDTVERQGVYAPLTEAGDLFVSSILASSYVALLKDSKSKNSRTIVSAFQRLCSIRLHILPWFRNVCCVPGTLTPFVVTKPMITFTDIRMAFLARWCVGHCPSATHRL